MSALTMLDTNMYLTTSRSRLRESSISTGGIRPIARIKELGEIFCGVGVLGLDKRFGC